MKYSFLISVLFLFLSCQSDEISLDFTNLEFPENIQSSGLDSSISEYESWVELSESGGIYCFTDKEIYSPGEEITLTIENRTADIIEYYYPSEMEVSKQLNLLEMMNISDDMLKTELDKQLVSTSPAMQGQLSYSDPGFIHFMIDAVDRISAEKMGYDNFESPLEAGKSLVFKISLPKRTGWYSFMLIRHSHDGDGIGLWGLNKFVYSNVFEIKEG